MASKLTKELIKNTTADYNGKELVVKLTKTGVFIKVAGRKWQNAYFAPWAAIHDMAAKLSTGAVTQLKPQKAKRGLLSVGG